MSKPAIQPTSREELLMLSREELVDIILQKPSPQDTSWVFDERRTAASEAVDKTYQLFCQQVAENFPNGAVAVLDRHLNYVHVAGQEMRRFGRSGQDFAGQPLGVLVSEREAQRIQESLQQVLKGTPCTIETTIEDQTYSVSAIPLVSADGDVDQVLAVSQNITERNVTLRQARESENQLRTLTENIPGVVYISTNDPERRIMYISGRIHDLCGYNPEDFLEGKISSRMLMHADDQQRVKISLKEAIVNHQPYHFTYRWKHRQGHDCWIEEYGAYIIKDQKQYFQGVLFDVSEKKRYEKELQQQNEDLKKANAELDHFAYSVSHDLRAPLTSAMGLLHLLRDEEDKAQRDYFAEIVQQSLAKLDNYIQDIIQLTKNARTDLTVEAVDLAAMIAEVVASQQQTAAEDHIDIRTEISSSEDFRTDPRRLWIVLNNLVSNAIRYYFPPREHSYVRIAATVEQGQLTLTVADNGIGIQSEHLGKIFNMFYRATDRTAGSGLGLYLVKETVARLGGSVEVDSEYEVGTTFTVRLPSLEPSEASS